MTNLSEKTKALLLMGAGMSGDFTGGYVYAEESLSADEAQEIFEFCKWIDKEIGGASRFNIDTLWLTFKNPTDKGLADEVNKIAEEIKRIKSLIK
jgi:hypothetical protein